MFIPSLDEIPSQPGTYILHLILNAPTGLTIGQIGEFSLPAGNYLYVGSAHGSGGLRARVGHHIKINIQPRWHLDHLRPYANIQAIWCLVSPQPLECVLAKHIAFSPGICMPVTGFGSSDCHNGCSAHFFHLTQGSCIEEIIDPFTISNPGKVFVIIKSSS